MHKLAAIVCTFHLRKTARNVAIDTARKQTKQTARLYSDDDLLTAFVDSSPDIESQVSSKETIKEILDLLNSINPSYRAVLILRCIHGMTGEEVAKILGWSRARVNVAYHRAIKSARQLVASQGRDFG